MTTSQAGFGSRSHGAKEYSLVFSAADKARWLESLAQNTKLTNYDVRICVLIGRCVDRHTGQARVGQKSIARMLRKELDDKALESATRSVRRSIERIVSFGYLKVVSAGGGRGKASIYEPVKVGTAQSGYSNVTRALGSPFRNEETRTLPPSNEDCRDRTKQTPEASLPNREFLKELPMTSGQRTAESTIQQQRHNREGRKQVEPKQFEQLLARTLDVPREVLIARIQGERIAQLHRKFQADSDLTFDIAELRRELPSESDRRRCRRR